MWRDQQLTLGYVQASFLETFRSSVWFSQVLLRCKTPLDIAGILFWWSCSWRLWRDYLVLPHSILNSDPLHVLQVHSLQREAVQMSGVREGLLSVQDSGRPQDVTHAGEGTEAQQDQIIQLHQRASDWTDGDTGKTKTKDNCSHSTTSSFSLSSSQRLEVEHLDVTENTSSRRKHFSRWPKE